MKREQLPGLGFIILLAWISLYISRRFELGGIKAVEASVLAVVLGIIVRNFNLLPRICLEGVALSEKLLIYGIVFLGVGLNFSTMLSQGVSLLVVILSTMFASYVLIYYCAKYLGVSQGLSILLAVGTTICGSSAIAITAPLIKAKEEETSYAIAVIALWGLVAILVYPYLGHLVQASDFNFGVFAGTAIHSTPQVVGAGFIFSEEAGQTATAVKLIRNCFMAPLAIIVALWYQRRGEVASKDVTLNLKKAFPWFLFCYFIMAFMNTQGFFTEKGVKVFTEAGKFLILLGMVGIGLNSRLGAFREVGLKPLLVGFLGALIVAGMSVVMIWGVM